MGVIILLIMEATILRITGVGVTIRYMWVKATILTLIMGIEGLLQQTEGFPGIHIQLNPMFIIPEPAVQAGGQVPIALLQIQEQGKDHR